jgi:hypothetical protein
VPPDPTLLEAVPAALARRALALPVELSKAGSCGCEAPSPPDDDPVLDEMRARVGAYDVTVERRP